VPVYFVVESKYNQKYNFTYNSIFILSYRDKSTSTLFLQLISTFQARADYIHSPPTGCPRGIYKLMILCWNFDHHGRPTFDVIYTILHGNEDDLIVVSQEEASKTKNPSSAQQLGGDPQDACDLYRDLQNYYSSDQPQEATSSLLMSPRVKELDIDQGCVDD
jgi:hypothetical protein